MKLLLWTEQDPASRGIAQFVRSLYGNVVPQPRNAHAGGLEWLFAWDAALFEVEGSLLQADLVDRGLKRLDSTPFSRALFLSKHSASSGRPAFTVHPIGNWGKEAELGGRPRTLAPSDPEAQRSLLAALSKEAAPARVQVSLESTHHGPLMEIPSLFVEVGSTPAEWENDDACLTVARAVVSGYLEADLKVDPHAAIGVGGGHYHPLQGEAVLKGGAAVGHLLPRHALKEANDAVLADAVRLSHAAHYVVDERGADEKQLARVLSSLDRLGLTPLEAPR